MFAMLHSVCEVSALPRSSCSNSGRRVFRDIASGFLGTLAEVLIWCACLLISGRPVCVTISGE